MICSSYNSKKKYHKKKSQQFNSNKTKKKQQGSGKLLENLSKLITTSFFNNYNKNYKIPNSQDTVLVKTNRNKKHYDIINKREYTINYDQYGKVIITDLYCLDKQFSYWVYLESDECLINLKDYEFKLDNSILSKNNTKKIPSYKLKKLLSLINNYNKKLSDNLTIDSTDQSQDIKSKFKSLEVMDSQNNDDLDLYLRKGVLEKKIEKKKHFDKVYLEVKDWINQVNKIGLDKIFNLINDDQDNIDIIIEKNKYLSKIIKDMTSMKDLIDFIKEKAKKPAIKKFHSYQDKFKELEEIGHNIFNNPDIVELSNFRSRFKEIERQISIINDDKELEKLCEKVFLSVKKIL